MSYFLRGINEIIQNEINQMQERIYGTIPEPDQRFIDPMIYDILVEIIFPIFNENFSLRNIVEIAHRLNEEIDSVIDVNYNGNGILRFYGANGYFTKQHVENILNQYLNDQNNPFPPPTVNIGLIIHHII